MRSFKAVAIWILCCVFLAAAVSAQQADVAISLNEKFFDALLDAVFQNGGPPEFPLSRNEQISTDGRVTGYSATVPGQCTESVRLLREANGVKTAVRFRDGKIFAPMAFTGSYNPPLIGCVSFGGVAETIVDLEFDGPAQRLVARARVMNVNLNGTGGVGGGLVARMVQNSIDRKVNPIEILSLDKVSFAVPLQNSRGVKMKAVRIRPEVLSETLNVVITYEFTR